MLLSSWFAVEKAQWVES